MKIVQIPSKVWVGSLEYALKLVPRDHVDLSEDTNGQTHFDDDNRRIVVAVGLPIRTRFEIVWHEITHAIHDAQDIDDPMPDEERVANAHGLAWTQFLLDNPRFVAWVNYTLERIKQDQLEESIDGEPNKPEAGSGSTSPSQEVGQLRGGE